MLFVGDDWALAHHDIEIVDGDGRRLARRRLPEGVAGITALHGLIADHLGEQDEPSQVLIGIETDHGPWVQALIAAGYVIYPLNPAQVARYRERHSTAGGKSDSADAHVLAEIVRLDRAHHRPLAADSALAEEAKLLARTHQNLIWSRQRHTNQLRSLLREFYPAALVTFDSDGLAERDALAVLAIAPTPTAGAKLTTPQIQAALRRAGRQRNIAARAATIQAGLRTEELTANPALIDSYGAAAAALVAVISELSRQINTLDEQVRVCFGQHPDAEIYLSQPGLGPILGARVLAEFGDDPHRYHDARARKNYSGMAPITRASGTKRVVLSRHARNRRLADALQRQAFAALTNSPGARAYYDRLRARNLSHDAALRALGNRLVGILHGCLRRHTPYDEDKAWGHTTTSQAA